MPVQSRRLARVFREYEPLFYQLFSRAISHIRQRIDEKALRRAIRDEEADAIVAVVPYESGRRYLSGALPVLYQRIMDDSGVAATKDLARIIQASPKHRKRIGKASTSLPDPLLGLRFDATTPEAIEWIRQHAGELIKEWKDFSEEGLRALVERAFTVGIPPRRLAVIIRKSGIGLTKRLRIAAENLRRRLEDDPSIDLTDEMIDKRVARYEAKLERYRSKMIARTETLRANNEAQAQLWDQAMDQDLLDGEEYVEWIASGLEGKTCPICGELDGETIKLSEYRAGKLFGGKYRVPQETHPHCMCTLGLQTEY